MYGFTVRRGSERMSGLKFSTKELQRIIAQPGYEIVSGELPDDTKDAKRNKFNAVSVVFDGIRFASKAEMKRYGDLRLLELTGQISALEVQPVFDLHAGVKYRGDFRYIENGQTIVEDVKSKPTATSTFKVKWKQVKELYPEIDFRIIERTKAK